MVLLLMTEEDRLHLRIEARGTAIAALAMLDMLGDELLAAAQLQYALDQMSYQGTPQPPISNLLH